MKQSCSQAIECVVMNSVANSPFFLVSVNGPSLPPIELKPRDAGLVLGRHEDCDLPLPLDADRVSRMHARLDHRDGNWFLSDLSSRWGTSVNGVRVEAGREVMLNEGDLIRISPFTFSLTKTPRQRSMTVAEDLGTTMVRTVNSNTNTSYDQMLNLLLESAQHIHEARDEQSLAQKLMDAALRGSGLTNAALLRPIDGAGGVSIIASKFAENAGPISFSRSLLAAAATGETAELTGNASPGDISQSIVTMGISSAICVPLTLGSIEDVGGRTVAAYLYLDSRGVAATRHKPFATPFCAALGRIASLALANLKRIDIERRQAQMEADLNAAGAAQKWILPPRKTTIAGVHALGESRVGQYVGGDFFDLVPLSDHTFAVTIGDVCGKGAGASVLMTATQGYLHESLRHQKEPAAAILSTNHFVCPRRPVSKFVTCWTAVIDRKAQSLRYVDAGHSYALLVHHDNTCTPLDQGGGPPIGMIDDCGYDAVDVSLQNTRGLLLLSDGIVEQFGLVRRPDGTTDRDQFGTEGAIRSIQQHIDGPDPVAALFADLITHAGTDKLADDATIVWLTW
jgi:phosphoserine phosphatase RsbU/P